VLTCAILWDDPFPDNVTAPSGWTVRCMAARATWQSFLTMPTALVLSVDGLAEPSIQPLFYLASTLQPTRSGPESTSRRLYTSCRTSGRDIPFRR
jgi:hypothetical protein